MSAFAKRAKSLRRTHRERGQPERRQHLGLLEKHKDYVLRAKNYHIKQAQLKVLHEKARNRNPDEFYYKMVNTRLKEGRHVIPQPEEKLTKEQLQILKSQDLNYVQMKLSTEKSKAERLKSTLGFLSMSKRRQLNSHVFFDSDSEDMDAKPNKRYPQMNSPTPKFQSGLDDEEEDTGEGKESGSGEAATAGSSYKELDQRLGRYRALEQVARKMRTQKNLMKKERCVRIPGDYKTPATYKWRKERKK